MAQSEVPQSFADTVVARLLALVLAAVIAAFLYLNWQDDFRQLMAGDVSLLPDRSTAQPAREANPALEACLEQRLGDVNRMKADGIINDAQFMSFSNRASDLCLAQNPSS